MKKTTLMLLGAAVSLALISSAALAQSASGDIFSTLSTKGTTAFQEVRTIAFVIAGFGIIAISVMAYFGRFNFKHLAGLIGGLISQMGDTLTTAQ